MEKLDPRHTALVLIDLQKGILPFAGRSSRGVGRFSKVCRARKTFPGTRRARCAGSCGFLDGWRDMLRQTVDSPSKMGTLPADWWEFPEELHVVDNDIRITKRQWGAFYGTELELQLRRSRHRAICPRRYCHQHRCGIDRA